MGAEASRPVGRRGGGFVRVSGEWSGGGFLWVEGEDPTFCE